MQNHPYGIEKKIAGFAFILSGLGLFWELLAYFSQTPFPNIIYWLAFFLRPIGLFLWDSDLLTYFNRDSYATFNFWNVFFCITGLSAAWLYVRSKYRETRLLQFIFSVIVLSQALSAFLYLTAILMLLFGAGKSEPFWIYLGVAVELAIGWLAFRCLTALGRNKVLETALRPRIAREPETIFVDASKTQRLANHLIDIVFCLLILSPLLFFFREFWKKILELTGSERFSFFIVFFIFRLIYYTFFESIFGATPGKYLTGTRVIGETSGRRPEVGTVVGRTLARYIPFEVFSFLAGGNWHDAASGTRVVREVRTGVKGRYYLFVPLTYIVLSGGIIAGIRSYEGYRTWREEKKEFLRETQAMKTELERWSDDVLITMDESGYTPNSGDLYLKVEADRDTCVETALIWVEKYTQPSPYEVEKIYEREKDRLVRKTFRKDMLLKAVPDKYGAQTEASVKLLGNDRRFVVKSVDRLFVPSIKTNGSGRVGGGDLSLHVYNAGNPCTIVAINNLEGDIQWENGLPLYFSPTPTISYNLHHINLQGAGLDRNKPYKCEIVTTDSLDRKFIFLLEGIGLKARITRVD